MRTTAVVLCTEGNRGTALHIGDSRFYHFRNGKIISQTKDHSVPQMLAMAGEISEHEIRRHPDRNRLLRALGDENEEVRFVRSDFEIKEGDAFLLCSDGFWEEVEEESEDGAEPERGYNITIDFHLMHAIDALLMTAAETEIAPLRRGSSFEHCTMTKLLEFDCVRLMEKRDVDLLALRDTNENVN